MRLPKEASEAAVRGNRAVLTHGLRGRLRDERRGIDLHCRLRKLLLLYTRECRQLEVTAALYVAVGWKGKAGESGLELEWVGDWRVCVGTEGELGGYK